MSREFRGLGPIPGWNPPRRDPLTDPEGYQAGEPLVRAVNVALTLSMPLLLTGEPGTGKTQLARRLAAELTGREPLRFNTKSSSQANDLFFTFDSMRYFAQSQASAARGESLPPAKSFVRYESLGEAILQSRPYEEVEEFLPPDTPSYAPREAVVLIDEIDKAPRDFPNDLLNQIENLEFAVPELRKEPVQVHPGRRPVVVITSNSERQLPDAFLRRCVYHHIEFPRERITEIVAGRLRDLPLSSPAYQGAKAFFFALRDPGAGMEKKPSTSELLDWLRALHAAGLRADSPFSEQHELARSCLGTLAKTESDSKLARELLGRRPVPEPRPA